jgi:hypothetical protein
MFLSPCDCFIILNSLAQRTGRKLGTLPNVCKKVAKEVQLTDGHADLKTKIKKKKLPKLQTAISWAK